MSKLKNQMLAVIRANARTRLADLSNRYIHARPSEKEMIQAAIEIDRWLVQGCDDCLE